MIAAAETDGLLDALVVGARVSASVAGFVISPDASPEQDSMPALDGALNPGTMTEIPAGYDIRFNTPQAFTRGDGLLKFGVTSDRRPVSASLCIWWTATCRMPIIRAYGRRPWHFERGSMLGARP